MIIIFHCSVFQLEKIKWNSKQLQKTTYKFAQRVHAGIRFLTFTEQHFPINIELVFEERNHFRAQTTFNSIRIIKKMCVKKLNEKQF